MSSRTDALADAPKVAVSPTSARPITSADAVIAVRRGSRIAFARASEPVDALPAHQRATDDACERPRHRREQDHDADEHDERSERDDLRLVDEPARVIGAVDAVREHRRPRTP